MTFKPADKQIEKELDAEAKLMCQAHNCPNKWSVDAGQGRLCSAHAWSDPMDWGGITQRIHAGQFTKTPKYEEPAKPMTLEEKRQTLRDLAALLKTPTDPKAWAYNLKSREEAGEEMSLLKKQMWRSALRIRDDA